MASNDLPTDDTLPLAKLTANQPRPSGLRPLGLAAPRDGLLYVPTSYQEEQPAPLMVQFHGAGSTAARVLEPMLPLAERTGTILLALDSRGRTWDVILDAYGPDVEFLDQALAALFTRYAVRRTHIAATGFSDGASYALAIGIMNSDLFTHIMAFSPGFLPPVGGHRCPPTFISHGTQDTVLPIERCSRRIVADMRRGGCQVEYQEFDGPHVVPPDKAGAAMEWFLGSSQV